VYKELAMNKGAKLFGHPIHPMLVVFPIGLLATSVIFDIIGLLGDNRTFHLVAFYMLAAGVIGGLIAALFGAMDWLAIPSNTRGKQVGFVHAVTNVIVLAMFIIAGFVRRQIDDPENLSLVLSVAALVLLSFGGWLGGELVYRYGIGVEGDNPTASEREALETS
jgi:uncharacterized membrane protein